MTKRKSGQARKTPSSSPTRGEDGLRPLDHDAGAAHVESGDADQEQNPYPLRSQVVVPPALSRCCVVIIALARCSALRDLPTSIVVKSLESENMILEAVF